MEQKCKEKMQQRRLHKLCCKGRSVRETWSKGLTSNNTLSDIGSHIDYREKLAHFARSRCKSEGCTNFAIKGRVCIRHGAKYVRKKCSSEGCTRYAQKKGVCIKHGAIMNRSKLSRGDKKNRKGERGLCQSHDASSQNCYEESTAFAASTVLGSEYENTT
jgi:hypothetical protein